MDPQILLRKQKGERNHWRNTWQGALRKLAVVSSCSFMLHCVAVSPGCDSSNEPGPNTAAGEADGLRTTSQSRIHAAE